MDERGFVHITGRKKEIIVTAGGENVAPVRRWRPCASVPMRAQ